MRTRSLGKAALSIMVVCIAAFLFSIPFAGAVTVTPAADLTAEDKTVNHEFSGIDGDYVVWNDSSAGGNHIYLYNTATGGAPVEIVSEKDSFRPNIDGNKVVYGHYDFTTHRHSVRLYTIADTPTDIELADGLASSNSWPDVSGDYVVYRAYDSGNGINRIYLVDLNNIGAGSTAISPTNLECDRPAISDGNVVYQATTAHAQSNTNIYLYNVSGEGTTRITADAGDYLRPNIDGDTVVYEDEVMQPKRVVAYSVAAGTYRNISLDTLTSAVGARVNGSGIVYVGNAFDSEHETNNYRVYYFNLLTGATTRISSADPAFSNNPDSAGVSGNQVVWRDAWDESASGNQVYLSAFYPTFDPMTDGRPININEGQTITQNPFVIKVLPTDVSGIQRVEFFIDGILVGTDYEPDASGLYECPWDTSRYHSLVRVVAYDTAGGSSEITRNTTVMLELLNTGR